MFKHTLIIDKLSDKDIDYSIFVKYNIVHCIAAQSNELQFLDNGEELIAGYRKNEDFMYLPEPNRYIGVDVKSFISNIIEGFPNSYFFEDAYGCFNVILDDCVIACIVYFINVEDYHAISLKLVYGHTAVDRARTILSNYCK
jgi:hypothetical protein